MLPTTAYLWGFTVDDALISARVAHHLASGQGYRFNPEGPLVDAVTPLGYPWLLVPGASDGPLAALDWARGLGLGAWLVTAALIGLLVARSGTHRRRWLALGVLGLSGPLAAYAGSGMETPLVVLLATFGLFSGRLAALGLGMAAAWRPELIPFAGVVQLGLVVGAPRGTWRPGLERLALVALPVLAVAGVRQLVFGDAAPLSAWAKPPDMFLGLAYALKVLLLGGAPWLVLLAPRTLIRAGTRERAIAAACLAHLLSLVLVGGDWMAFCRLATPILPACVWLGARALELESRRVRAGLRVGLAIAASLVLLAWRGPSGRGVLRARLALIEAAHPQLSAAQRVACADVGWVGAAFSGQVVDPAGVTDPTVATLPGSHLHKRLGRSFLRQREVDRVLVLVRTDGGYFRPIDRRLANEASQLEMKVQVELKLPGSGLKYLVYRVNNEL